MDQNEKQNNETLEALAFIQAVQASMRYIYLSRGGRLHDNSLENKEMHLQIVSQYLDGSLLSLLNQALDEEVAADDKSNE